MFLRRPHATTDASPAYPFRGLAAGSALPAQQFLLNLPLSEPDRGAEAAAVVTISTPAVKKPELGHGIARYLDLNFFNYGIRYRSTYTDGGAHVFNQSQQKLVANGKFKFDDQGKYGIGFHLSSGRYFNWASADFIGGGQNQFITLAEAKWSPASSRKSKAHPPKGFFNSGGGQLYFRQAFLTAQPVKGIEAQFGGIALAHGVNTEATSYDDDGYMTGERISVRRPKQLFLSEASYTLLAPFKTWREAILVDVKESKVLDSVRFEAYQRINKSAINAFIPINPGKGYTLTLTRQFGHYGSIEGGLASIDNGYFGYTAPSIRSSILGLTLNGDQYGRGRRCFVRTTIPITRSISLAGNFSHLAGYTLPDANAHVWNAQMLTAGFVVDGKKLFFPAESK